MPGPRRASRPRDTNAPAEEDAGRAFASGALRRGRAGRRADRRTGQARRWAASTQSTVQPRASRPDRPAKCHQEPSAPRIVSRVRQAAAAGRADDRPRREPAGHGRLARGMRVGREGCLDRRVRSCVRPQLGGCPRDGGEVGWPAAGTGVPGNLNVRASRRAGQYRGRPASVSIRLRGRERSGVRGTAASAGPAASGAVAVRVGLPPRPGRARRSRRCRGERAASPGSRRPGRHPRRAPGDRRRVARRWRAGSHGRPRARPPTATSRTLKPPPFPRLMAIAAAPALRPGPAVRGSSGEVASSASTCARARSST